MNPLFSPRAVPAWFLVLPDTDAAAPFARAALPHTTRRLRHPSGRPWLVGRWAPSTATSGGHGSARIAVIGDHAVSPEEADRAADAARSPAALDRRAAAWPGNFHLVSTVDGEVRVRCGAIGVRRVHHTRTGAGGDAVTLASDRADVLADLTGAALDERHLAVELLTHDMVHPLSGQPVWRGVRMLPAGHSLTVSRDGAARETRWWSPPKAEVPLRVGAVALRDALAAAVQVRTQGRDLVTADLGGLDSTAVYCTAVRSGAPVVAYTVAQHDALGDDVHWARRTVAALDTAEGIGPLEHHVVPADAVPMTYDGLDTLDDVLDGPSPITVDRNRRMRLLELAAARGSHLHLSGLGGDELLAGTPARLHGLLTVRPAATLHHLRGYTAKYRWPRRRVLRALCDRRDYGSWLRRVADHLADPPSPVDEPLLDWATFPRMPPWATPDAVAAVRDLLRAQSGSAEPLARDHGEHRELAAMDSLSRTTRYIDQISATHGVTFAAPYYDDQVVEAALAVTPQERITPWQYKPLIVAAMRGTVPEAVRSRATKANATFEEEAGLREHRAGLLALCEQSHLARLGLIDARVLRAWCARPLSAELETDPLHRTVACEVWLRSRQTTPVSADP
ncbi:lasso peptide isopeptide bond-forming cyclase [Streptomyces spectabilis]|uniref:asparagine synthase (glutamine-hydrolyzing) n=1 Tax=Streptomyces spectabilis TaxID=68270 RepID=A0A516RIV8_STRST|nr:lasso peptide isopeptide bond-forming cyclase [Streptomyces spectabilis]QDQ15590.1 lasso peptide isopeptide bond-forming cyclase [Streptomyces spectabilis]